MADNGQEKSEKNNAFESAEHQNERKAASVIVLLVSMAICFWVFVFSVWEKLGEPVSKSNMSLAVLGIAALICAAILKFTDMKITDMGIRVKNARHIFVVDTVIAIVGVIILALGKYIFLKAMPETYFDTQKAFFDFTIFKRIPILYYPVNVVLQEFMSRGVMHESMRRVFVGKHRELLAILVSSAYFGVFHIHMGVYFMIFAPVMLGILGVIYNRQKTFWGLCIPHYVLGITATMLGWI